MCSGSIADAEHVCNMTSRLNDQRKEGQFCDVLLKVSGRTLPTHACVLSACSPYFRHLIVSERPQQSAYLVSDGMPQQIVLDVPALLPDGTQDGMLEAVSDLLDYVYTGKIQLKEGSVETVVRLAEALTLEGLASLARSYRLGSAVERSDDDDDGGGCSEGKKFVLTSEQERRRKRAYGVPGAGLIELCSEKEVVGSDGEALDAVSSNLAQTDASRRRSGTKRRRRMVAAVPITVPVITHQLEINAGPNAGVGGMDEDDFPSSRSNYTCRECGFTSADRQAIRDHRMIHNGKSYVCRACDYITIKASKLVSHLLSSDHPDTVSCSLCQFSATTPQELRDHVRRHDHAEPFFCDLCELRFRTRSTLTIHVAKHSAETPFACPRAGCPRAFKLKRSLQAHMVTHSGQKCHMCEHCGYRTAYKSSFNSHVLMHTGAIFKCTQEGCSFRSIRKKNLKDHILTHAPQKPYQCEVCGQNFSYEQSLKRHAKMHSADRNLLSCDFCPFTSIRRDKLREHVRKHHKDGQQIPDPVDDMFNLL